MAKKTHAQSTKSCSDCIHEYACRMWTDGRMISDESASRCSNHTTVKESAAYLIGKMDGEKSAIPVEKHRMLLREMYEQGKFDGALEAEEAYNTADVAQRAEVAREILEEIEQEINAALQNNYKVLPQIEQSESLWNRVSGKINALRGIDGFIAELKDKYTGESQ